jgi:hypothetical protein
MRYQGAGVLGMTEHDDAMIVATERFERRMAEENGKLRVEMANGFGSIRAEMIDRNAQLLRWMLVFNMTQVAAISALFALYR